MGLALLIIAAAFMVPVFLFCLLLQYFKLRKTAYFIFFAVPIVTLYIVFRTPSEYKNQKKELCASIPPYENFTLPDRSKLKYVYSNEPYPDDWGEEDKFFGINGDRILWHETFIANKISWKNEAVPIDGNTLFRTMTGHYGEFKMVVFNNYSFTASGPFRHLSSYSSCYDFLNEQDKWKRKYLN